jgi:alpha,alpha-trehalase
MDLVEGILRNWVFEIQHYGLIPNANRTYYLMRSQPPFVTDLSRRLYDATKDHPGSKALLKLGIQAAIKEYHCVWVNAPRLDSATGLSKYHPAGVGIPLEVEPGHYDIVIKPFADKHSMSIDEFTRSYNHGNIDEPELEKYLEHDRGVMESGHDTSVRLEGKAANLAIIDLNCLLYKYERDIAVVIDSIFDGKLDIAAEFLVPAITGNDGLSRTWESRAKQRKAAIDKYLWDESQGIYLDYDVVAQQKITSESVTCLWALWSGVASAHQAEMLVSHALPKFEYAGGLVASSESPAQNTSTNGYQWDYPLGWAPHQMLAWDGLARYGYHQEASRLAYRWLHTITKVYVDYGTIFEKYNVTRGRDAHKADAEYGNQGGEFVGYAREGLVIKPVRWSGIFILIYVTKSPTRFGWTNASYVHGLSYLDRYMQRALALCAPYEALAVGKVSG